MQVCWGRLPKGEARSSSHQLSRRAKWAAVLQRAGTPEGGGWAANFAPEDMTPQRLQASGEGKMLEAGEAWEWRGNS